MVTVTDLDKVILGVDPGKSTGIAVVLVPTGALETIGNYTEPELIHFLSAEIDASRVMHIVMENFIVYKHRAAKMVGSKMEASKIIGMVTFWANQNSIPVTLQMAHVLSTARKQTRIDPSGAHAKNHWADAANHALYWAYERRLIQTPLEKELNK